jgi:hypothetical protein
MMDATTRAVARAQRGKRKEGDLVAAVIAYLNSRGAFAWRMNSGRTILRGKGGKPRVIRLGRAGLPDVIGTMPARRDGWDTGRLIAVECKSPGQQPTALQAATHAELRKRGALVIVCHDLADVARALGAQP